MNNNQKDLELVDKLITLLQDRGGFDDWWGNIDEDTQTEIISELASIIKTHNAGED